MINAQLHNKHWSAVIAYRGSSILLSSAAAHALRKSCSMNSSELDQRFDNGESILEALDLSKARRQRLELRSVNIDSPLWMVEQLDREA